MSQIYDEANVGLIIGDYIIADPQGKLNVVGGGIQLLGFNPETGTTAGFAVASVIRLSLGTVGQDFAWELALRTSSGEIATIPGPAGSQNMRIAKVDKVERPHIPGVPDGAVAPLAINVIYFANGLPLVPGESYFWEVSIDGETKPEWRAPVFVPGTSSPPVLG